MRPLSDASITRTRRLWRKLSQPPFADPDAAEEVRVFSTVAWLTAIVVTTVMVLVVIAQPDTFWRAVRNIVVVDVMVALTTWMAGRGRVRLGVYVYLGVIIALITFNALPVGGIRSPGVPAYLIFVMLAGLLLGPRAGVRVAIICAALGLALVAAERMGVAPGQTPEYNAVVRWLLLCMYMAVALATMRVATARVERALAAAQRELAGRRATEERLERALDAGRIGVFEHDLPSDRVYVDGRAQALLGVEAGPDGAVRIAAWQQTLHPDDRDSVATELAHLAANATHRRLRYRILHPDGTTRHIEAAAHAATGMDGTPVAVHGMLTDVTDREQAAHERERLVVDLGERVKELRLLHDAARLLHDASGADRLLLSELAARMPAAWLHADDACARISYGALDVTSPGWCATPWTQSASFNTREGSGTLQVSYRSQHPEADEGPFLAEERALLESLAEMLRSHIERYAVERERQAVEAQLRHAQKMDALGTLAGGIAHDFNNILTAVGVNLELAVLDTPAQGPAADSLAAIRRAYLRARDLVRRILLFSQRQQSSLEVVSLVPVVNEAVELLRAAVPPNVVIRTSAAAGLPAVRVDPVQLHQVVMNLGTNAAYAMRERGGTLTIDLDTVALYENAPMQLEPGTYVRLTVADTGVGMDPEVRERLFEPFFTTKGQAGTGLGLSIVHGIVVDHGGSISVTSEIGAGTTFEIHLPAYRSGMEVGDGAHADIVRGAGQRIMYVDDEEIICHAMTRLLVRLGYRCTGFTDPAAAIHEFRIAPHDFDAVITDLQMPGMSGFDVVRAIHGARPDTPVAIASGYPRDRIVTDPDSGSVEWIAKPATLEELAGAVGRLVQADAGGDATNRSLPRPPAR